MSGFYNEKFIEDIKNRINNGEFVTKEALAQYLKNIPEMIANNQELLRGLESYGIEHNTDDLNNIATVLLDYYDKTKVDTSVTVENPAKQIFEQMDDCELEYTLNNRFDSLTDEQKKVLRNVIEERKIILKQNELQNGQVTLNAKPKVKTLTMKNLNKKYNGFTSIVFICLLTSIYGTLLILYLLISNGMLK